VEFILIHKPIGASSPEGLMMAVLSGKDMAANPKKFVPNGQLVASYYAVAQQGVYCIWDVPKFEDLIPLVRMMTVVNWDTEIVPVQKPEIALPALEKAMMDMQAQMAKMTKK
jgi:hypothetical protein